MISTRQRVSASELAGRHPKVELFIYRNGRIRYSFPLLYMTRESKNYLISVVIMKGDETIEQKKYGSMEQYSFHVQNG